MSTEDAFVIDLFNLHHGAFVYAIMAGLTIATLLTGYLKNNKVA
ncbi:MULTISPECIES: hypothetical protein [Virgibacillus]|nr:MULTISPECIES: hypothetical protein [Virgibacillus]